MNPSLPSVLPFRSRFSQSGQLRIHWLDGTSHAAHAAHAARATDADPLTALLFVPGMGEEALDHTALIELLAPRRVIIPDLRGRGPSDTPESGFTLGDHVADLDVVIRDAAIDRVHIASYSRGTAYAVKWAIENPDRVASIAIGDYPAQHIKPPPGSEDFLVGRERFGRPMTDRVTRRVMSSVFMACTDEDYYDGLARVAAPLLLIHGGRKHSLINGGILVRYRASRPDMEVELFEESGHDLWIPDPERFARRIARFIDAADARALKSRVDDGSPAAQ